MPVGEYKIKVHSNFGNDLDKKNSFELAVKAEQAKVTLAYKDYGDWGVLNALSSCVNFESFCTE